MQDTMGESTRGLREQIQISGAEELNLITGNPLYMFAFPALVSGRANQETGQWSNERVLERGWVVGLTGTEAWSTAPPAAAAATAVSASPAAWLLGCSGYSVAATPAKHSKASLMEVVAQTLAAFGVSPRTPNTASPASAAATNPAVDRWDDGEGNVGEYSSCRWEEVEEPDLERNEAAAAAAHREWVRKGQEQRRAAKERTNTSATARFGQLTPARTPPTEFLAHSGGHLAPNPARNTTQERQSPSISTTENPNDKPDTTNKDPQTPTQRRRSFDWAEDAQQAADETEARDMAKRHVVETERRKYTKKQEERRIREQKQEERREREDALAKRQREERAAEIKRQMRKDKKKKKKKKKEKNKDQKTVAQIAAENAARLRRNSS
ncbi:hypothetical protein V8F33_011905 [Rhypophila sp. PSN 637]